MRPRSVLIPWLVPLLVLSGRAIPAESPLPVLAPREAVELGQRRDPALPRQAAWSGDARRLLLLLPGRGGKEAGDLTALDPATGERTVVLSQEAFCRALDRAEPGGNGKRAPAGFVSFTSLSDGKLLLEGAGLFLYDPGDGSLLRLTRPEDGAVNPALSPDGRSLAFTREGSLVVQDVATGRRRVLAEGRAGELLCGEPDWLYAEELDLETAFWWSPDSRRIAFLRFDESKVPAYPLPELTEIHPEAAPQKYPRPGDPNPGVSLGVAEAASGRVTFVAGAVSGDGYLPGAAWAPDGQALLFQLLDRGQERLQLRRAEIGSGLSTLLIEETSPSWVNVFPGPWFLEGGRFLWLSERDGYAHLYLCAPDGAAVRQVTAGPWVVDEVLAVDAKRGEVYFAGNRDNLLGRDLYRADLARGTTERLTDGKGWHDGVVAAGTGRWLDQRSTAASPPEWTLRGPGRRALFAAASSRENLTRYGFVAPQFVTLRGPSGEALYGKLYRPRDEKAGDRYPVLVDVYGGPHAQMVQDKWAGRWEYVTQMFLQRGYVVFSLDNRGSARRGRAFESALLRRMGKAELEDQLAGVAWLRGLPFVDGERVGIWGWSYGGFLTLYALAHAPEGVFAAGAAVAPVADWMNYDTCYTERYLKLPADNPEGYRESSPAAAAAGFAAPVFLAHGLSDDNVHFGNSAQMADALLKAGKPFEPAYYPRMDHGVRELPARQDLFARMAAFFDRHLKRGG